MVKRLIKRDAAGDLTLTRHPHGTADEGTRVTLRRVRPRQLRLLQIAGAVTAPVFDRPKDRGMRRSIQGFLTRVSVSLINDFKSDEFSFVFLRRLRFGDGRRPIAL
jgi:hypothetical protein